MNLRNFGNEPPLSSIDGVGKGGGRDGGRPMGISPLARQTSVYSLTFDELQTTLGGAGKDFGSMNMDELLKSVWGAEETQQTLGTPGGRQEGGGAMAGGNLQRQGSLTLPRILSQKTVEEVWKEISREGSEGKNVNGNTGQNLQQPRQRTLGEITLEDFLLRAGVVMEDTRPLVENPNSVNPLCLGFHQIDDNSGLMGNRMLESNNVSMQPVNLPLDADGLIPHHQQQQQPMFSQQTMTYTSPMSLATNAQLTSTGMRGGIVANTDPTINSALMHGTTLQGGGMGMVGVGTGAVISARSPADPLSSDRIGKSNEDTSSVSPVPFLLNGGIRGRKRSGAVDKVVERRQRRMIKNRESAARSRARKQAHTLELEAEVAKLKEENKQLREKKEEIEMQKNQILKMMELQQREGRNDS